MEATQTKNSASSKWVELLGSNNWEGLLNPLDLNLRHLILLCGDLCQATYDAFNNDANSKYAGSSRYGKKSFFRKVMLQSAAADFEVQCFLYATAKVGIREAIFLNSLSRESWDRESNWIGYVAVTTDEVSKELGRREIYVVWRGTSRNYEWINVFGARPESAQPLMSSSKTTTTENTSNSSSSSSDDDSDSDSSSVPKVMKGWLSIYVSTDPKSSFTKLSARKQLSQSIEILKKQYENETLSITLTGHSLGASLAILSAFDLVENGVVNDDVPVTAIVFGSPQVGNKAFNDRLSRYRNLKILHVRNKIDLIPLYPSALLGYTDTGIDLVIDNRKSPNLKESTNPSDWHNLQAMLHVVAGWNGDEGEFELKVKRSLALVNKSSSILKDEYLIPGSWWVEKNKGMIFDEIKGEWVLAPPSDEDQPTPEF